MIQRRWVFAAIGVASVLVVAGVVAWKLVPREPVTAGGPTTFRRLSELQYVRSIESVFGSGITIPGRFDPPRREDGLLAVGDSRVVLSSTGFEQAEVRAREIAAQVMSDERRKDVLPCAPSSKQKFDQSCAEQFVQKYGRLLYRRPLDAAEQNATVTLAKQVTEHSGDFTEGMKAALSRLLASPHFLFRVEQASPGEEDGDQVLDDYSLASRISFMLWNAPPDDALLDAAEKGDLRKKAGIAAQVDRMMDVPQFEQGVRAFFSDMFGYDQFDGLTKEQAIFPMFSSQLAEDAREQTLRTIVDLLITNKGDYRDLFTTRKTFLNRNLSALYGLPAPEEAVTGWAPYTFAPEERREGFFTLAGFLMLDPTHEGRSSPTIRGKSVRELFLCQVVPPPPPGVDFTLLQDTQNSAYKTARDRLVAHSVVPTCAGCHAVTDPIGLALEHYDGVGEFRATENGAPIDASGTFEGKQYKDAIELQRLMHDSPALTSCLTKRVYEYGVGRPLSASERDYMTFVRDRFAKNRFELAGLMRTIATSNAFRAVSTAPSDLQTENVVASN